MVKLGELPEVRRYRLYVHRPGGAQGPHWTSFEFDADKVVFDATGAVIFELNKWAVAGASEGTDWYFTSQEYTEVKTGEGEG